MLIKLKRHLPVQFWLFQILFFEKTKRISRLKNFCRQKKINLTSNNNIKEEHLSIKKLHLNRKGNGIFAKNLLNFMEGNWDIRPLGDSYYETQNASNTIISDAKRTLRISISNINRLVFGHLSINSLSTKFNRIPHAFQILSQQKWRGNTVIRPGRYSG